MTRWRKFNWRITEFIIGGDWPTEWSAQQREQFSHHMAFAWWFMLIPIAGIAGIYIASMEANRSVGGSGYRRMG